MALPLLSLSTLFPLSYLTLQVVWTLMARWWEEEGGPWHENGERASEGIRILDMAAGR